MMPFLFRLYYLSEKMKLKGTSKKGYQPPKKILSKNEILELVGIDDTNIQLYMLDEQGRKIKVDTDEGVELKSDIRFLTSPQS